MKRLSKNSIAIILMSSSIVLLLVLEGIWLRSAWRDAEEDFRKETNSLFRSVVLALNDSMIDRNLKPLSVIVKDSLGGGMSRPDSIHVRKEHVMTQIEIYTTSSDPDSVPLPVLPVIERARLGAKPIKLVYRVGNDTLNTDSIRYHYAKALEQVGIAVPFQVITLKQTTRDSIATWIGQRPAFVSEEVRVAPFRRYAVSFSGVQATILREVMPEILFCTFLTLLTAGSFVLMFRALRAQQRLVQMKSDFIGNVTHELKTPVATVSVALEALRSFRALEDQKRTTEYLDIAQNELNRLMLMTDKILKTAVFEDNGVEVKFEYVDIDEIFHDIIASLKVVFEKRNIRHKYTREGTDFTLSGAREHLTNVIFNLVDNAIKYGGKDSLIEISLNASDDMIRFSIRDHGVGIPQAYQGRIFEKFFRVPSGDIHDTKGYGLGLSYVANVVKRHGGSISVDSQPQKGSCFTVQLPKNQ